DFNLLGTQSSSAMNIINGQTTSKLIWAVGLEPKHAGTFSIPALNVAGAQTQPLSLTVRAGSGTTGKSGDDVFLEVNTEPLTPYVQQQVRVTVKLFYALNLTDGNLEDPHGDGLNARKLGQDAAYTADVDGRHYRVLERHYALTPEKSGAVTMAPIVFRGHAVNPNDINSFFTRGHGVSAQVAGTTFDVRPRPPGSGSDAWLPAQSLTLSADGVDASSAARVGEPLTLTLHLKAQGLGFEQLPELKLPKIDGADIYPDKETTQNRDDGDWQFGERARKFAIVPNRPGTLTLPALSLAWWDTQHDRAASAELPALRLNVAPAVAGTSPANVQNATNAANATNATSPATVATAPAVDASASGELRTWRMLALVALSLWVLTVIGGLAWLLRQRRRTATAPLATLPVNISSANARKAFNGACARDDVRAAARGLLAWARTEGSTARTLGDLARALGDDAQRTALLEFEHSLYGAGSASGSGERLAVAFRDGLVFASRPAAVSVSPLPPLYPFAVRKESAAPTLH
ncbi:MAG TPA: BatD family protein, partial [Rudaea sp.]|uniref:BatD family protein n=1 Tax=Rudaea sp. TaxID=2136325 RepID=UPI002F93909A